MQFLFFGDFNALQAWIKKKLRIYKKCALCSPHFFLSIVWIFQLSICMCCGGGKFFVCFVKQILMLAEIVGLPLHLAFGACTQTVCRCFYMCTALIQMHFWKNASIEMKCLSNETIFNQPSVICCCNWKSREKKVINKLETWFSLFIVQLLINLKFP